VAQELDQGQLNRALMVQAIAESHGDAEKAKSIYIRLRSDQLHTQLEGILLRQSSELPSNQQAPVLDSPLDSFTLKKKAFFGGTSHVVVRKRSITFSGAHGADDVTVNPDLDEWGLKLSASIMHGRNIFLIHRDRGCIATFLPSKRQYQIISQWLKANGIAAH
jgi:hypothetical protein